MGSLDTLAERHRKTRERAEAGEASSLVTAASAASRPLLRLHSRIPVIEAATGGGFVRGGVYMIHGEPGSGKSTLIGQAAGTIPGSAYVSAEEGVEQLGQRFMRLGYSSQLIIAESEIRTALHACEGSPFVVIDSISTMKPGILTAAASAVDFARGSGACVVLICHETKGGRHAGPRKLEHLIDCTLSLSRQPRVLVVEKNRFGPAPLAWELTMSERGFL